MTDDSPRVPVVTAKSQLPEEHRHHYERIENSRGHVSGPFAVLLNSPELGGRIADVGTHVRFEGTLTDATRELAILVTARELDCAFEWVYHEPLAREADVNEAAIDAVVTRAATDELAEREAVVVQYGRELFDDHEVSDEVFRSAAERFGVRGVTELTATMGYYSMLACVLNALEVLPDGGEPGSW